MILMRFPVFFLCIFFSLNGVFVYGDFQQDILRADRLFARKKYSAAQKYYIRSLKTASKSVQRVRAKSGILNCMFKRGEKDEILCSAVEDIVFREPALSAQSLVRLFSFYADKEPQEKKRLKMAEFALQRKNLSEYQRSLIFAGILQRMGTTRAGKYIKQILSLPGAAPRARGLALGYKANNVMISRKDFKQADKLFSEALSCPGLPSQERQFFLMRQAIARLSAGDRTGAEKAFLLGLKEPSSVHLSAVYEELEKLYSSSGRTGAVAALVSRAAEDKRLTGRAREIYKAKAKKQIF